MRPYTIVLVSPSDLTPERDLLGGPLLAELNNGLGRNKGIYLDLFRWEVDTHPGFHPQGWQGLIDDQLKITDADLLIAMFWKRFGTPIVGSTETGTEHEIGLAYTQWVKTGKPDLAIYFKEEPFFTSSVADTEQFLMVNQFRGEIRKGGKYEKGSYGTFVSQADCERKLRGHLNQILLKL